MDQVKRLAGLAPRSLEGQLIAVVVLALVLLLGVLAAAEIARQGTIEEWAESEATLRPLRLMGSVLDTLTAEQAEQLLELTSTCHRGYSVTPGPFSRGRRTTETLRLENRISEELGVAPDRVSVHLAILTREDFSYAKCSPDEFDLPVEGIVIGLALRSGLWLNAEVHPHEWHKAYMLDWAIRTGTPFLVLGCIAILMMRRLSRPLGDLTAAAQRFGQRLEPAEVEERGPPDLERAISAFNQMQRQVTGEVTRRATTLAAMSHDLRTPLTALRIKAELVEDREVREDLVRSIDGMERIAVSSLDHLRGQSQGEPMVRTDLRALVESECDNFSDRGERVTCRVDEPVLLHCRPEALARALRNLIENAMKYGGEARVELRLGPGLVDIMVADRGPGIPSEERARVLEPFERVSAGQGRNLGGFGLGMTVAKEVCESHQGELLLADNLPTGLRATMRLPLR